MDKPRIEDFQDVALLRQGDKDAFERIYRRYWAKVYNFASLYLPEEGRREEVTQDVFVRLWKIRERLDPERGLDGFLFIVTRNMVFSQARRSLSQEAFLEAFGYMEDRASDVEAQIEADDLGRYVDQLVDCLPPRQKETYLLSRKNGLSHKEISSVMGISERGVERNIYLALKFIKENLPLFLIFLGYFS